VLYPYYVNDHECPQHQGLILDDGADLPQFPRRGYVFSLAFAAPHWSRLVISQPATSQSRRQEYLGKHLAQDVLNHLGLNRLDERVTS
jgi:hypothetical protein